MPTPSPPASDAGAGTGPDGTGRGNAANPANGPAARRPASRLAARIHARTPLHEGFLQLHRYTFVVQRHGGGSYSADWELMERGNSVGVLGYDPDRDAIVLGNEFRPGAMVAGDYPFRDQLIAGAIEAGESPIDAAAREIQEEAGLALRDAVIIHPGAYVSSGGTSEKIALVFGIVDCAGVSGTSHGVDATEDVLAVVLPAEAFIQRVTDGTIDDCKTLVAGYWFARYRATRPLKAP